jgi:GWxTD domain-containing protein
MSTKEARNEISRALRRDSPSPSHRLDLASFAVGRSDRLGRAGGRAPCHPVAPCALCRRLCRHARDVSWIPPNLTLAAAGASQRYKERGSARALSGHLSPVSGAAEHWGPSLAAIAPWLGPFWITGVCLFCLWYLASWASVERMRRRGVCCARDHWQRELTRLSAELRVSRPVLLLESCLAEVPVVLGHFRPLILLPIGVLAGLPPAQMEAVLVHELAHIRRHDYLMNLLQRFAEGLLFYHPAVWWFSGVMRNEQEKCCDDVVVSVTGQAHEYALALVALEQSRFRGRQTAIAVTGGNLMKRIHRLLYPKPPSAPWSSLLAVAVFLSTTCASFAAWQSEPSKQSTSQAKTGSTATSYSKWLNEDVVYIIDDGERAAFQKLTTDQERDHFIEQFWERRNPAPGSSPNKFKEEHYHRLAYANQHFRTASGTPGWQTIAATCSSSMVRRTRLTLTKRGPRGLSEWRFGYIGMSKVSATTSSLPSSTGPAAATFILRLETRTETCAPQVSELTAS